MRHFPIGLCLVVATSFAVQAHVRVQPAQSQPGVKQTYSVRVPTEGKIATTALVLDVPDGVSGISTAGQAELTKIGGKTVSITWKVEIPPGQSQTFTFEAINPGSGQQLVWKAHQRYADGSVRDWTDAPGSKNPAPVTGLGAAAQQ
jgi:uncharacterized protein YcnI